MGNGCMSVTCALGGSLSVQLYLFSCCNCDQPHAPTCIVHNTNLASHCWGSRMLLLLCRGVIFLNATPFWSFMPHPETAPRLVTAILPWNGTLPVPRLARFLVKNLWWNLLSRRRILQSLVRNVYADKYVSVSRVLFNTMIMFIMLKSAHHSAFWLTVSM